VGDETEIGSPIICTEDTWTFHTMVSFPQ